MADLADYRAELTKFRLIAPLRRRSNSFKGMTGNMLLTTNNIPKRIKPAVAIFSESRTLEILRSGNNPAIISHCEEIYENSNQANVISDLAASQNIIDCITELLSDESCQDNLKIALLQVVSALFAFTSANRESYTDSLVFIFLEFLQNSNIAVIFETIRTIGLMASKSGYARDSMLSFGINDVLIAIAMNDDSLSVPACNCIYIIYSSPDPIDLELLQSAIVPLKQLLSLDNKEAVIYIIQTFSKMADKNPSIVYLFFEQSIHMFVLQAIADPEMSVDVLELVCYMCRSKREHVKLLLDSGLFEILTHMYQDESIRPHVLLTISNMIESSAPLVIPFIDEELCRHVLSDADDSSYDIKREATYLLATIICYIPSSALELFVGEPKVGECLVEMCTCSIGTIIVQCIGALTRLVSFSQQVVNEETPVVSHLLFNTDIHECLQDLLNENDTDDYMKQKIVILQQHLDAFKSS